MENGRIIYFGNPIGYTTGSQAVVDPIFKGEELETYLKRQSRIEAVVWKGGVYDRLINGQTETQDCESLKNRRVWQLKPDVDIHIKSIGYNMLAARFEGPDPQNYHMVYDGEIETNRLGWIYDKFDGGREVPGYTGHFLSMLDIVELYDEEVDGFCYIDCRDFRPVVFGGSESVQSQVLQL